jgi:tetratricopeptide (TPR) repeat protein
VASAPLLGSGLGAYADAFPPFKQGHGDVRTTHAESDLLEFMAEGGLAGIALFVWLGWSIAARTRLALRREPSPFRRGLTTGAIAGATSLLLHGLVDFNLRVPSNALVFVSLLGLACADTVPNETLGRRKLPLAFALGLALLAVVSAWRARGAWELARVPLDTPASARVATLGAVLEDHPYLAEAHRARGLAWRELAKTPSAWHAHRLVLAERHFEATLRLRPQWGGVWADLGWTRAVQGRLQQAEEDLGRAVALDPTHVAVGLARAEFLAWRGQIGEAIDQLARTSQASGYWSAQAARGVAEKWSRDPALLARIHNP